MNNPSRKAHLPNISSFTTTFYFFPRVSQYTWIVFHDHTVQIGTINEIYNCTSLTKCPSPMVINAAIVLFFFWYTQVMMVCVTYFQQSNLKGVLPLTSVQHVQKSILGLYMIWQKMHLLQSKRGVSPYYTHFYALLQVKHVTLSYVSIKSRVTGPCLRWCVRIQPVKWIRIPTVNWARRPGIRDEC